MWLGGDQRKQSAAAASVRPRHVVVSQVYKATYLLQLYATIP